MKPALLLAAVVLSAVGVSIPAGTGVASSLSGAAKGPGVAGATSAATSGGVGPSGGLALIVEPDAGMAPIYALVRSAHTSLDMVMYELDDPTMEAALAGDAQRGVAVRVILDRTYVGSFNAAARTYLDTHGVDVQWASDRYELTHEKSIIIDGRVGLIMTLNLGPVGYYSTDRDFAVVDARRADVGAMSATFDADWAGRAITAPAGEDLLWSPGAEAPLVSLIASARSTLAVENEEMDDPAITGALIAAARRGVRVQVVMTASSEWASEIAQLVSAGVRVRTYPDSTTGLYIHAKVVDVDAGRPDARVFIGSQNFSRTSLLYNRELGIVTTSPTVASAVARVVERDFAGATPAA